MVTFLRRSFKEIVCLTKESRIFHSSAMNHTANGLQNESLIEKLKTRKMLKTSAVKKLMLDTDRAFYCPRDPYQDTPQSIGYDATISAPHMHAMALELVLERFSNGFKALDVGSGSGYLTAAFARANREASTRPASEKIVVGIEHHPALVALAKKNIRNDDPTLLESGELVIIEGDGRKGYEKHAPYDVIHVGAAAPNIPEMLLSQLANGGRMICPIGPAGGDQTLELFDKDENGEVGRRTLIGVIYVPLTDLKKST